MTNMKNVLNKEDMDKVSGGSFIDDLINVATKEPVYTDPGPLYPAFDPNFPTHKPGGYQPISDPIVR